MLAGKVIIKRRGRPELNAILYLEIKFVKLKWRIFLE